MQEKTKIKIRSIASLVGSVAFLLLVLTIVIAITAIWKSFTMLTICVVLTFLCGWKLRMILKVLADMAKDLDDK